MNQQQQLTAAQQIQQLTTQLSQAFVQKEEAQARIAEADKTIVAIRNLLAGVGLGQQLFAETQRPAEAPADHRATCNHE